ncbi:shikimate dehydrogenase family protein [Granulosicoccus sp. 3-233]|uniref:shikimate dehydrogenase family protein n=1 Tax=Granulosicoccus sp. 3-233 TaxID=3417969 RepID=UPI003D339C8E
MTQLITGHTRFIAHLGVPTESFRAPMIYNPYFDAHGIDVVVLPMGCEPEDYVTFLPLLARQRNFVGALVTMPFKKTTVALLDEASTAVQICGACNAVRRNEHGKLIGDMFDGQGFTRGVSRQGYMMRGVSALVVGAGGVGSSIAASLAEEGVSRLGLFDTDTDAALQLAEKLQRHYPCIVTSCGSNDPVGWDIVINATPLGMSSGDPMPIDVSRLLPDTFVGEVVMKQEETAFLAAAREQGCRTQIGTDMLYEQIPAYLEFFGLPTTKPDELRKLARLQY